MKKYSWISQWNVFCVTCFSLFLSAFHNVTIFTIYSISLPWKRCVAFFSVFCDELFGPGPRAWSSTSAAKDHTRLHPGHKVQFHGELFGIRAFQPLNVTLEYVRLMKDPGCRLPYLFIYVLLHKIVFVYWGGWPPCLILNETLSIMWLYFSPEA